MHSSDLHPRRVGRLRRVRPSLVVATRNLDRLCDFYVHAFDGHRSDWPSHAGEPRAALLGLALAAADVVVVEAPACAPRATTLVVPVAEAASLRAVVRRLTCLAATDGRPHRSQWARWVDFDDPDGVARVVVGYRSAARPSRHRSS